MTLKDELQIAPKNELRHVGKRTKGSMGQTEIDEYEEIAPDGKVIARYTVTEHTNLRGLDTKRTIEKQIVN
jgi:hypothetical protein